MDGPGRKTVLIATAAALGGALLVGGTVFALSQGGDDDEGDEDPTVVQLELAAETATRSNELGDAAEAIANGEGGLKPLSSIRNATTRLLGRTANLTEDDVAARPLRRANEANLDATGLLETVGTEMSSGRTAIGEEEEASDRLAGLSTSVGDLGGPVQRAQRRASAGVAELQEAVAAISAQIAGSDEAEEVRAQLTAVEQNLRRLNKELRAAFGVLSTAADSLSGELGARSEELEPDVVLDCPEIVPDGAGVYGVSVRNMTCAEAAAALGEFGPPAGFACTELESGYEYTEYRCTSGDRAIRYGVGA